QVGGSAGGILGEDMLDTPLDIDSLMRKGATLGSGVVLVCDNSVCPVDFMLHTLWFFKHESCGQCTPCRIGCNQLFELAVRLARRTAEMSDVNEMMTVVELMQKTSLCALGQSPIMPIRTMLKYFRDVFEAHCSPDTECPQCDASLSHYFTGAH
ncbi:MAG TPA: NADH-ubiquinone oxidoreductase-F iron-sulfur binding region domain-containing protein, partial [bacterium]|nr:NADH-ubiquinone oxidoreductase-F iron-sulfur binding region domain-containing protein [bacterium]